MTARFISLFVLFGIAAGLVGCEKSPKTTDSRVAQFENEISFAQDFETLQKLRGDIRRNEDSVGKDLPRLLSLNTERWTKLFHQRLESVEKFDEALGLLGWLPPDDTQSDPYRQNRRKLIQKIIACAQTSREASIAYDRAWGDEERSLALLRWSKLNGQEVAQATTVAEVNSAWRWAPPWQTKGTEKYLALIRLRGLVNEELQKNLTFADLEKLLSNIDVQLIDVREPVISRMIDTAATWEQLQYIKTEVTGATNEPHRTSIANRQSMMVHRQVYDVQTEAEALMIFEQRATPGTAAWRIAGEKVNEFRRQAATKPTTTNVEPN